MPRLYPLKPNLAPVRIDTSRTEEPVLTETAATSYAFQDHAFIWQAHHTSGFLINNPFDPVKNAEGATAVRNHLYVELQPTVPALSIDSGSDLVNWANLDQFPWLQV
jgi:hypothetical protein